MASVKVSGSIPSADMFSDDRKKHKKKKAKKLKKEKLGKQKSKAKGERSLKDYAEICDPEIFARWPEIKKEKRKKKRHVSSSEEFPLTQNKNLKPAKRQRKSGKSTRALQPGVQAGLGGQLEVQLGLSSTQKEMKPKKRVAFNLSPVLLEPRPLQNPFVVRDMFQTQCSGTEKKLPFNAALPADGRDIKPAVEGNGMESQSTSDDVNSQDLFITQKSFSDPYTDLCCSTSAEEPQGYTETQPDLQSYPASSPEHRCSTASCPGHQSLPKKPLCRAYHPPPPRKPSHQHKRDASTQTENFFTCPLLATSLVSRHRSTFTEEPMDLSLPKRSRLDQWDAVSKASLVRRRSEPDVTDLTQSDDSDSHLKSKADLSQLKVVQTRLNESFFFKLKGDGDSPKPRSPLMKFAGSGEKKKP